MRLLPVHIRVYTATPATLDLPELDLALILDRTQFEAAIAPATAQFWQALEEALSSMGADAEKIDRVICVGGSLRDSVGYRLRAVCHASHP